MKLSKRTLLLLFVIIVFTAFFMRFYHLGTKPLHHDEGSNWFFYFNKIANGEQLTYMPNYHGLTFGYLSAIPLHFMELSHLSIRLISALFGAATVLLLYPLRKLLGNAGLLVSSLFLAVSPTMVYYSRHVSPYSYFVFFLLLSFVSITLYLQEYKNRFLYLSSIALALLLTTHELAIISYTIFVSFIFICYYYNFLDNDSENKTKFIYSKVDKKALALAVILYLFVVTLIASSFMSNLSNLPEFVRGFMLLADNSFSTGHNKPFSHYASTFMNIETPVFLGSFFGLIFFKRTYFSVFIRYWVITSFIVYSFMPYKTPWIFTIVLLPMFILVGLTADSILSRVNEIKWLKNMTFAAILICSAFSLLTAINLNYIRPTSRSNTLNYVGPSDNFCTLIEDMDAYLAGREHKILITAKSYWPLPYYLREHTIYYKKNIEKLDLSDNSDYSMLIVDEKQLNKEDANLLSFERKEYELRLNYGIMVLFRKN